MNPEAALDRRNFSSIDDAFSEAIDRVHAIQALDDESTLSASRTLCHHIGRRTDLAVVLFHGFTNSPAQYATFAELLLSKGCNVFVPRLPGHGDVDRMSRRLESVTADQYLAAASDAVRIGRGLGRRLAISGISLGGLICAWLAAYTTGIDRTVSVAPNFALPGLPFFASNLVVQVVRKLPPNFYLWWDPKIKEHISPNHAYPRYPLRALGECYQVGAMAFDAPAPASAGSRADVTIVINPRDPAVNNDVTRSIASRWSKASASTVDCVIIGDLPAVHDIIEPESTRQRIDLVYPVLADLIMRSPRAQYDRL